MDIHWSQRVSVVSLSSLLSVTLAWGLLILTVFHASSGLMAAQNDDPSVAAIQATNLPQWGAITLFHGLPSDRVRAIAQGADGSMWFGTDGGLANYDGRRTHAVANAGLPQGRVQALRVGPDGVLWVGTESGAARLIGSEFRPVRETEGKTITAIIVPEPGRALMTTEGGQIIDCRVEPDDRVRVKIAPEQPLVNADRDHPGPLPLTGLALHDEAIFVGTRSRGLLTFAADSVQENTNRQQGAYFVETVESDRAGRLWYGTKVKKGEDSGLYFTERPHQSERKISGNIGSVVALHSSDNSSESNALGRQVDLWVGTDGRGVFHFVANALREQFTFEGTAGGLRSNRVYAIFTDREGVVWFGTDRGVCRYDARAPIVETLSESARTNFVRTLYQTRDGKFLLCGTNRGLFFAEQTKPMTGGWRPIGDLARQAIYAISEDASGRLLVGTNGGLYAGSKSFSGDADRLTRIEADEQAEAAGGDSVRAIARAGDTIYFATYGRGVERLDERGRRSHVWPAATGDDVQPSARNVVSLFAGDGGDLWIGTAEAGVFILDGRGVVRTEPSLGALQGRAIWGMKGDSNGGVWFATERGLFYGKLGRLNEIAPEVDARSLVVAQDESRNGVGEEPIWCATAKGGVLKILMDGQLGPIISRFDAEQGLPSQSAFALLRTRSASGDEVILFGTSRGIARYVPSRARPVLTPARVVSKRLHPPDELQNGNLQIEYPQNSLVLDVAAMSSRTFPEQYQYAFWLYDAAGRLIKKKFSHDAQFSMENLRPGKHRVMARAYSVDLVASDPYSFEFDVGRSPFPWTVLALSILLALALVALLWGSLQNRRIARASAELAAANHEVASARLQLANEAERERRRIARDLHDQTLADLRRLQLSADHLPPVAAGGNSPAGEVTEPSGFRAEIEAVSQEIRRICEDLSPSVLDNVGLAAALEWALVGAVGQLPRDRRFAYEFSSDEGLDDQLNMAPGVRIQIYRIAQEAINNICRHSKPSLVRLSVRITNERAFLLELEDDGNGFDPRAKKVRPGRGLTNIRARASLIEAEVEWQRRPAGGTRFTLRKEHAAQSAAPV